MSRKIDVLCSSILKARQYAHSDPETALMQARKSAEAICRHIFAAEIGEPGTIMLDELIKRLAQKQLLPRKILIPLGTIQAYGNYGAHAQAEYDTIDMEYITPCLSALAQVTSWYFLEYLRIDIPDQLKARERRNASPSVDDASGLSDVRPEGVEERKPSHHRSSPPIPAAPRQPPVIPTDADVSFPIRLAPHTAVLSGKEPEVAKSPTSAGTASWGTFLISPEAEVPPLSTGVPPQHPEDVHPNQLQEGERQTTRQSAHHANTLSAGISESMEESEGSSPRTDEQQAGDVASVKEELKSAANVSRNIGAGAAIAMGLVVFFVFLLITFALQ